MDLDSRSLPRQRRLSLRDRGLYQARDLHPGKPLASEMQERFGGEQSFAGQGCRIAVRPGLDLTICDLMAPEPVTREGEMRPGTTITVMLDGGGEGTLSAAEPGVRTSPISYEGGTTYLFHARVAAVGQVRLPVECRFRFVELRLAPEFLASLGVARLFEEAGADHPMHRSSAPGIWIGTLPTPPAVALSAGAIIRTVMSSAAQDLAVEAAALNILNRIIEAMRAAARQAGSMDRAAGRDVRRICAAKTLILSDVAAPWTIRRLAKRVGLNEKKLKAGFRAQFGTSIRAFIQDARLETARAMLANDAISVTEAALAVGYTNPSYFTALFKRKVGTLPSAFSGV
jgi:AraC-like DNA-binding protein